MSSIPITGRLVERGSPSTSLGRNLILLLSGYLAGIAASHACSPPMEGCALAAAAIGLIAHAVLCSQARQKQAKDADLATQKAAVRLERRVEQHVRIPAARFMRRLHAASPRPHEQYMTVVRAKQTVY